VLLFALTRHFVSGHRFAKVVRTPMKGGSWRANSFATCPMGAYAINPKWQAQVWLVPCCANWTFGALVYS
jgi:hypothetical protein